ncbi:hypothetical protein AB0M39_29465 [Streptomyces sp. NPDC051907]|uniref:hypothetical protein n=1 Tax=Streptomyces sp. NPDC051907 TaxID=3155284 RepID=UPI003430E007
METAWDGLPEQLRERVDGLVLKDRRIEAIWALREATSAMAEAARQPSPEVYECQTMVMARYEALADQIVREPERPRDVETLSARISESPGRLAAVEAVWDGDTDGWFVVLEAVFDAPPSEAVLATIRHGSDMRVFNGQVPPWPEAQEAMSTGAALAERFGVPFHFASPDEPDDQAPRWRDSS